MCASKIGYWAAASRGSPTRSRTAASETSEPRAVIAGILSRGRSRGRSAHAAGTVADAPGVAQRGEDDAMLLGDALVVSAAAPADDPRCRGSDEHRRRALEREQERLHLVAERVVPPAPVAADDPVARDDHRHRVPAEGAADGARGARKNRLGEKLPELQVEVHRQSSSARLRIALPLASWLLTVLTEMPRILASSRYESPST